MVSFKRTVLALSTLALVHAQGVIMGAKGNSGTSKSLAIDYTNPEDATYISKVELKQNIVNECGRTLLSGDISQAGTEEEALAAGEVTTVTKGSNVTITINQKNSNGTGPYTCDMDQTGNSLSVSGQTDLTVYQDSSEYGTGNLTLTVTMPSNMKCTGASTGNICTIRCVNQQSYGGCVAVEQTDVKQAVNKASKITTAEEKTNIEAQVKQDQKDLAAANAGLASSPSSGDAGIWIANSLVASEDATNPMIAAVSSAVRRSLVGGKTKVPNFIRSTGSQRGASKLRWAKRYVVSETETSDDDN